MFLGGHGQNGCGHSRHGTVKLTVSQKWMDGITDFLLAGINSGKLINGCGQKWPWFFSSWDSKICCILIASNKGWREARTY